VAIEKWAKAQDLPASVVIRRLVLSALRKDGFLKMNGQAFHLVALPHGETRATRRELARATPTLAPTPALAMPAVAPLPGVTPK